MFRENIIIDTILNVALVLRISIPFLLYRNEKLAILPIIAFCILFGVVIYTNTFNNTILNMGKLPSAVFNTEPLVHSYAVIERPITGMAIMRGIIYWIWLIPVAAYAIQLACKQTKSNGYPWYYLIGGIMFRDKVGITFLRMAILLTMHTSSATRCKNIYRSLHSYRFLSLATTSRTSISTENHIGLNM